MFNDWYANKANIQGLASENYAKYCDCEREVSRELIAQLFQGLSYRQSPGPGHQQRLHEPNQHPR